MVRRRLIFIFSLEVSTCLIIVLVGPTGSPIGPNDLLFTLSFTYQARERQRREEQERLEREAAEAERKRKEEEEARERAEHEAAEKAAALAKLREEKSLSLGAEPEKGPNVTQVSFLSYMRSLLPFLLFTVLYPS